MAKVLNGLELSQIIRQQLAEKINNMNKIPGLAVILVGNNPASMSYVKAKEKACADLGIKTRQINFPEDVSEDQILNCIKELNTTSDIHGILVQLPLPKHINTQHIIDTIAVSKDVDGFTTTNVGKMLQGEDCFLPCTPYGILKLLEFGNINVNGKHVVVLGRSNIVGKPIANLLFRKDYNATVTICHTGTPDVSKYTRDADVVIVATGQPNTLFGDMLKPGAVVIDVGVNRIPDSSKKSGYRLVGDADFESCSQIASAITPVPGGVGPMTITMLLWNTVRSCELYGTTLVC